MIVRENFTTNLERIIKKGLNSFFIFSLVRPDRIRVPVGVGGTCKIIQSARVVTDTRTYDDTIVIIIIIKMIMKMIISLLDTRYRRVLRKNDVIKKITNFLNDPFSGGGGVVLKSATFYTVVHKSSFRYGFRRVLTLPAGADIADTR